MSTERTDSSRKTRKQHRLQNCRCRRSESRHNPEKYIVQVAKEAEANLHKASGGDRRSEDFKKNQGTSNLTEVEKVEPIRTMQKAANMAGRILLSKVEEQIAKEAAERVGGRLKKEEKLTANLPQVFEEKKRNDTTAGQMAKKIDAESPPGTGGRSVEECQK